MQHKQHAIKVARMDKYGRKEQENGKMHRQEGNFFKTVLIFRITW